MPNGLNELSVREHGVNAGGDVVDAYVPGDSDSLHGKGEAVLFVHGYNNSRTAAIGSFEKFIGGLEATTGRDSIPWPVFGVQWPGDEANAALGVLAYPLKISVARRAAEKIFAYLAGVFGPGGAPIMLHVVAHSLGCRLTLELMQRLSASGSNVVIKSVTLMASACPIGKVSPDGPLRNGVDSAKRVCVLHSTGDAVLHWAFPVGQTAGGDGFFPTAIGRFGGPTGVWTSGASMSNDGKLYGHSSYWPGTQSASVAAAFMGIAVANTIPVSLTVEHELAAPNAIGYRTITDRMLP